MHTLYHRLTSVQSPKSTKSTKAMHKEALAEIVNFYKNPTPTRMITDDKAPVEKLKSIVPKKVKFNRVRNGKPSICQRCKKCPRFCKF